MKLKEWAKKQGISYLTSYRWFKDGKLPVKAYQSDSGTIIVQDDNDVIESGSISDNSSHDAMALFMKKTVEFSANDATIADFAAYVISNFTLKLNSFADVSPKYSKIKPKPEEIQNYFKKFMKPLGEKPKTNIFLASSEEEINDMVDQDEYLAFQSLLEGIAKIEDVNDPEVSELPEMKALLSLKEKAALKNVFTVADEKNTLDLVTNLHEGSSDFSNPIQKEIEVFGESSKDIQKDVRRRGRKSNK